MRKDTLHSLTGLARYGRVGLFEPATLRVVVGADDRDMMGFLAIALHEYAHYWDATGTLYGNFGVLQRRTQSVGVYECIKELVGKFSSDVDFKVWVTLRDWRSDLMSGPKFSLISKYLAMIDAQEVVLSSFEGFMPDFLRQYYPQSSTISFQGVPPPEVTSCPQIRLGDSDFEVGGLAVMEGFAQFWQIYLGAMLERKYPDSDYFDLCLAEIESPLYSGTMQLCRDVLGTAGYDAFPIVSDLALLGPMPMGCIARNGRYTWEDVHPGWRLCRSLQLIKDRALMSNLSVAHFETPEGYRLLTDSVCAAFGWPRPDELTRHMLDGASLSALVSVPGTRTLISRFREAWEVRRQCPHAFAFPIHCYRELTRCLPPLVFGQRGLIRVDPERSEMFLSILAQEITATGLLDWPEDESGLPLPGVIECPAKVLDLGFICDKVSECEGLFPRKAKRGGSCWFDRSFSQAFGISSDHIASVWR